MLLESHRAFRKITPINGFDQNIANAKQNNYAWSMAELGDYIYVGTARNIPDRIFNELGVPMPRAFRPSDDNGAEIWRYKKDGNSTWEKDLKAPPDSLGIRDMISYKPENKEEALYAIASSANEEIVIYKRTKDSSWQLLSERLPGGSSRTMVVHNNYLYIATIPTEEFGDFPPFVFRTLDPEEGWEEVDFSDYPQMTGSIYIMASYNNHLYLGFAKKGGFEIWRSEGNQVNPEWKLVIDRGAGDRANLIPFSLEEYNGYLYLGTGLVPVLGIALGLYRTLTKGFDIIRIDAEDKWRIIVGGPAAEAVRPTTGNRNRGLYPSGFGNPFNAYCWQLRKYKNILLAGSFDWSVLIPAIIAEEIGFPINCSNFGFDLWLSNNGLRWSPITINGLGNPYNYGARKLFPAKDNKLYLGTANPFQGCEVWVNR